jgi:hypothetical protein
MSALGADTELGYHLSNVAATWEGAVAGTALRSQLEKSQLGQEDRAEIGERLHSMARCYTNE